MSGQQTQEEAEVEAKQQLRAKADSYYEDLELAWTEALPGNHSAAYALFLAHLMSTIDGYRDVTLIQDWHQRPKAGWHTTLCYSPELDNGLFVRFVFECRYNDHVRQLAILLDETRPGERLPAKMDTERRLVSLGYRVMSFTAREVLTDTAECRERVEGVLSQLTDEVLVDAEQIKGRDD